MSGPEDILKAAFAVVARGYDEGLVEVVCRALLAERERCAKLAAGYAEGLHPAAGWSKQEAEWWSTGALDCSLAIASAIRKNCTGSLLPDSRNRL